MKDKINVAELLKGCPSGMELDCTMFDDVVFDHISVESNTYPIFIKVKNHDFTVQLTEYGQYMDVEDAKCVILPKGKTTWEGFHRPFKDGDILYIYSGNPWICIYKEGGEKENVYYKYVAITTSNFVYDCFPLCHRNNVIEIRHATEEEKQKLFQEINDNGYKWNEETKTLEKLIEPKFKVGDKITDKNKSIYRITEITDEGYKLHDLKTTFITFEEADLYFVKVVDIFDINTLVPFESRVLVRENKNFYWKYAIFRCYIKNMTLPYYVLGGTCWEYCIPYEGNEHLLGTTDDCDEFYKTWK